MIGYPHYEDEAVLAAVSPLVGVPVDVLADAVEERRRNAPQAFDLPAEDGGRVERYLADPGRPGIPWPPPSARRGWR